MRRLDHFAVLSHFYDRVPVGDVADRLRALLSLPSSGVLLDCGGGTGRIAQALREPSHTAVVLDLSRPMLQKTRKKAGLLAVQGESERLPLASRSIARLVMVDAFHHLRDQKLATAEMARVLAPGGLLVMQEPDLSRFRVRLLALGERLLLMRSRFFTGEEMRALCQGQGLAARLERDPEGAVWVIAAKLDLPHGALPLREVRSGPLHRPQGMTGAELHL